MTVLRRLVLCAVAAGCLVTPGLAPAAPALTPVATFAQPLFVASPPGDKRRVFVVEREGRVQVLRDGVKLAAPFLDVASGVDTRGEGGLISLVFAPDYATSGLFYLYLTPEDSSPAPAPIEVREYRRSATDPDRADPASARTVLTVPHPSATNHYGGGLAFGPDGLLYASTGDGGGAGDPEDNASDLGVRLGKILRLSPVPSGGEGFTVPPSNPFAGPSAGDDLIWSYGLRNPFRFSFDRLTGDLSIGDVGQGRAEEIDFVPATAGAGRGANFQWNDCEGPFAYPIAGDAPCGLGSGTAPVHFYGPAAPPCSASVTGGVVVRDPGLEELSGRYVYGDFCEGFMRSISLTMPTDDRTTGLTVPSVTSFGEDACGRVYVTQITGAVSRLEDGTPSICSPPVTAVPPGRPPSGPAVKPLVIRLSAAGRQRALRRGAVLVKVRCEQACGVRALGRLSLRRGGSPVRLREAKRRLAGGATATLRLELSRAGRFTLRRAHHRKRPITATVTVRARGGDGGLRQSARRVRLVR